VLENVHAVAVLSTQCEDTNVLSRYGYKSHLHS